MKRQPDELGEQTSPGLEAALGPGSWPLAVLIPVGSVEPHGPHLPLVTDTLISQAAARRAVALLAERDIAALVAPAIAYGVTDYARGFAGAISIPAEVLGAYLRAVVAGFMADARLAHACLVSNHLEPAHDAAVRAAVAGLDSARVTVATPLERRWARTLSEEFKKGECHAGRYETSIVLAAAPHLVDEASARSLPAVPISLSEGIRRGLDTFAGMGLDRAYAGAPAEATADEGHQLIELLAIMVCRQVAERVRPETA